MKKKKIKKICYRFFGGGVVAFILTAMAIPAFSPEIRQKYEELFPWLNGILGVILVILMIAIFLMSYKRDTNDSIKST